MTNGERRGKQNCYVTIFGPFFLTKSHLEKAVYLEHTKYHIPKGAGGGGGSRQYHQMSHGGGGKKGF